MARRLRTPCFWFLLFALSLVLFSRAARKPFWFDEILTLKVAQAHLGAEMWKLSTSGFEFNPPGIYVATRLSELTFGRSPIASRLPSILSGLIVLFSIFRVSSRQGSSVAGFGALFFLCFSGAFDYFTEARGYALAMAGTMIAWMCWQVCASNTGRRPLALFGIFLGLSIALTSHIWAIVVPACFLVSAAVSFRKKTVDAGVVASMAGPYIVALCYIPIVATSRTVRFDNPVYHAGMFDAYALALHYIPELLLVCAVAFLAYSLVQPPIGTARENLAHDGLLSPEDTAVAICLICAPVGIYGITWVTHGAFMSRYALFAALGIAVLSGQVFTLFERKAPKACLALLVLLGVGTVCYSLRSVSWGWQAIDPLGPELTALAKINQNIEPIVYCHGLTFLQADYYAPADMAARLVYVADRDLAKQIIGTDGIDSVFVLGREELRLRARILSYSELVTSQRSFWLIDDTLNDLNWISEKLRQDGAIIQALNEPHMRIYHVSLQ